ncbi:YihY/virulence factor BrkB family protein [Fodinibius salsisoli]|uniref:YihY/virulence factor BrkB family protein n=1 Tax=Fodinibius salsisoli TaxID=2820877 RepID=A0ABT3PL91_9BACT|nr:YihY/virulence factor BrkB family protein [Fodinibius salsisoli]MCW9706682.1 YihY/virulence factor BrkB family protein [Fodinibius salsisoli]
MKKTISDISLLLRKTLHTFGEDDPIILAGALAFFTVFAIPPILIMVIFSIGLFTGQQVASTEVFNQIQQLIGPASADVLQNIVSHYFVEDQNILQRLIAIGIFLFASSSFFLIIQHALNRIWSVKPRSKKKVIKTLENRALSFGIIMFMGFILVLSLGTHSILLLVREELNQLSPLLTPFVLTTIGVAISFMLGMLSFGVIFKFLPDVIIEWKVVWVGAAITSCLFLLGKYIIGFALTSSNIQAMYGTAGSMAIYLLWVFYSSLILFFGAKMTQQYAYLFAETIQPKEHAVKIKKMEVK